MSQENDKKNLAGILTEIVMILKAEGVSKKEVESLDHLDENCIDIVKGQREKILKYVPFSEYDHYSELSVDSEHKERAYILDKKGKKLCNIQEGYSVIYSDSSTSSRAGESVEEALKKLEEKASSAKYVLVEVRDKEINGNVVNPDLYFKDQPHKCRGFERKNDRKITIYEL